MRRKTIRTECASCAGSFSIFADCPSPLSEPIRAPLFPLDELVLLPGIATDLHVFELRYREMLHAALAGDHRIAMAVHDVRGSVDGDGAPAVHPYVCLGTVTSHQGLPDGRSLIRLEGQAICSVVSEDRSRSYRVGQLAVRPAATADTVSTARKIQSLWSAAPNREEFGEPEIPDPPTIEALDRCAFRYAAALPLDTETRLQAVGLADIDRRLDYLTAAYRRSQQPPDPSLN